MKARKIAQNIYKISKRIEREIGRKEGGKIGEKKGKKMVVSIDREVKS